MKSCFYQVNSDNSYYIQRWIPRYQKRVYVNFFVDADFNVTLVDTLGFKTEYEYGYSLGIM